MTLDQTKDGVAGKAFVTGAAGCVGRELVRQLLKQGAEIWCLLLPGEEERFPFAEDCRISVVTGDINNLSPRSVPTGSTIYHLAAKVHVVPQNEQERQSFFEVNRDGTRHLAEIAVDRQAVGFVFISTIAVYGDALRFSIPNEAAPTNPTSAYGQSKLEAEEALADTLQGKVPYAILRPCVVYGPGDRGNFSRLIRVAETGRFPVASGGKARKNTLYVGNLARILKFVGDHARDLDGSVLNVADKQPHSMAEIARAVGDTTGKKVRLINLPYALLKPFALAGDLIGRIRGREFALSSRRLRVMSSDSLVDVTRLHEMVGQQLDLLDFSEGLGRYFEDKDE